MNMKERIQTALRQEKGLRLTAAEVQGLASLLKIGFPARKQYRPKPSISLEPQNGEWRFMRCSDLDEVVAMDIAATGNSWTKDQYKERLGNRAVIARVMERPDRGRRKPAMVGAIVYERCASRCCIELERIVVAPEHQLHSFGRQMIALLQSNLHREGLTHVRANVDERNLDLLLFFRSVGFTAVDTWDGNVVMEYYWDGEPRPFHEPGLDPPAEASTPTWKSKIYGDDDPSGGSKV